MMSDSFGRSMGAVRTRKGIIDVHGTKCSHLSRELWRVVFFARMEPRIFHEQYVPGACFIQLMLQLGRVAPIRLDEFNVPANGACEPAT